MEIQFASLQTCAEARGVAVVIDVLRAFSTAAYAFAAGAEKIFLVRTIEDAFELQQKHPGSILMGEVGGLPIPGFDFGNSPAQISRAEIMNQRLIQRTSAGTQGVILSTQAESVLAASFVCAGATGRFLQRHQPERVTFVVTGLYPEREGNWGEEDRACAEFIAAQLQGQTPDPAPYLERARRSSPARLFADPAQPEFPAEDLEFCLVVDRFDFAMQVRREAGMHCLEAVHLD